MADWYYSSAGRQIGPIPEEALRQMIQAGHIQPADLVWREGMPNWTPAGTCFPLPAPVGYPGGSTYPPPPPHAGPCLSVAPPPHMMQQNAMGGGPVLGYSSPMGMPLPKGMAVASMVLGIIALALFCVWYVSIPCAIISLILGGVASGRANRGEADGKGMATAGIVCSVIALALVVIAIIWIGAMIANMFN